MSTAERLSEDFTAHTERVYAVLADLQRRVENLELVLSGGREAVAVSAKRIVADPRQRQGK